ncbi:phosphopantetheine-binding protein [Aminobacter anthyllidis]|uniref:phosphopantetheine-binding protein n=1 Tax=Aminobacter anthyllidis TaxID=1035067 RepID=UPI0023DF1FFA|nr:phosphopantetheine-binding protein [Aminobacter anthyllidis]
MPCNAICHIWQDMRTTARFTSTGLAPRGAVETALAQIWAELLGVERIGRHDNFFELGGHSLLAVQLLSRLSRAVGVELPLTRLFARPVLSDLAESVVEVLSRSGPQDLPAIVAVSRNEPLVPSFAQQRIWFLPQLDEGSTNYHIPLALRLRGVLDRSAWQRSLDRLFARHEALRSVFVASEGKPRVEVLPPEAGLPVLEHDLRDRPDAEAALLNVYGPTEATIDATAWVYSAGLNRPVVPIGRPIANTRVYLLDAHGAPVPFGAVGELYIGGAGVARGYLNRPELTAERFLADPFSDETGARIYKTGDLARYLPDGNLEFLGRNDDQVKIRGFRIEPGEIAARLIEHAWVREAVVVARQDRAGDKHLVAYVVCAPEAGSDDDDGDGLAVALRAHLASLLPHYMVPSAFVRLAALPLTVNGKLDRKALPAPDDEAYARTAYEAPQGAVETALAGIWAELLGVERVGRHDNFFELGGHSLLAVQLLSRASDLGLNFSAADAFQAPVLKDLASKVHLEPQPSSAGVISVQATGSQPPLFFVPTGFGDCSYVVSLVKEMNVDCPVFALPWPSFDEARPLTLEAIADTVILEIKEIQPHGPYRFAGYSSGGILAYAIAQRLLALDETVSFMAFIDVTLFANRSSMSPSLIVRNMVLERFESLNDETFEVLKRFAGQCSIAQLIEKAKRIGAIPPDRDLHDDILMSERTAQFHRALQAYQVPSLPIEIHQFYAMEPLISRRIPPDKASTGPEARSPMRGWDRVLSPEAITAVPIVGDHVTMISDRDNPQMSESSGSVIQRWEAYLVCRRC